MKNNIILKHSTKYIKTILIGLIFLIISPLLTMLIPILKMKIIDEYIAIKDYKAIINTILFIISLHTVSHIFEWIHNKIFYTTNCKIVRDVRGDIFYHIFFSKLSDTKEYEVGDLITRTEDDIKNMSVFLIDVIVNALRNIIVTIISLAMLVYISWRISLVIFSFVIIYFLFTNFFKKKIHELSKIYIKTLSDSRNTLISLMNRIVSIKINSYEKYSYKIYDKSIVDKRDSNIKLGVMRNTGKITINYLLYLMPFIVLLMGSLMTVDKLFTIGSIIAYLDYLTKMITSLEELNELNFNFAAAKISSERINEVINLKTFSEKDELSTEINMRDISVSFNDNIILNDIEFKIKDCDKVSIIGKSGSGKSTLVDIITGNQTADNGDINFGQLKYYNGAYIPPEPYIFQGDLEDNIVLDSDLNAKKYHKVLDICLIDPHEAPYNGSLNNLSYGEKQRVELARALYKGKRTLIIDEGISNIDLNDLNLIIDNLLNLENLTLIYISHNQEIARKFPLQAKLKDKKLVFEK